ncbi:MAG: single-stranded DNA-binding protein, partial [Ilumatobacteraceae bacterium]
MSNTMTVVGNLTGEPELRFTQGGAAMLTGSIADNRRYQVNGEWQEETSYINFVAWRELAENAAASLSKGMRVIVTGRLQQRDWTDKDGNTRKSYDLV